MKAEVGDLVDVLQRDDSGDYYRCEVIAVIAEGVIVVDDGYAYRIAVRGVEPDSRWYF